MTFTSPVVIYQAIGNVKTLRTDLAGAYPGGPIPGGPSESLILAPSELKNVALTPSPPPLNMTRCETRHCNYVRNIYSDLHVLILMHTPETKTNLRRSYFVFKHFL